jgi:hypothetical protein
MNTANIVHILGVCTMTAELMAVAIHAAWQYKLCATQPLHSIRLSAQWSHSCTYRQWAGLQRKPVHITGARPDTGCVVSKVHK